MARRNIGINIYFTLQPTHHIKTVIHDTMFDNLSKKCAVYTNTALSLDILKFDIENWLNSNDTIRGDAIVIQDNIQLEMKLVSTKMFTASVEDPEGVLNRNELYPRLLLATPGSIGTGLDSNDVHSIV